MVKIRLTRLGRKGLPFYRLVAMSSKTKRDGKALAFLGTYNPRTKEANLKAEEIKKFLGNGAQPTQTVESLLKKAKILGD